MSNTVSCIGNAGIFINYQGLTLLIDALHHGAPRLFSAPSEDLLHRMVFAQHEFSNIDYLLITHEHADHYEKKLCVQFLRHHPETSVIAPSSIREHFAGLANPFHIFSEDSEEVLLKNMRVRGQRLSHDHARYASIQNYAFEIYLEDLSLLVLGDAGIRENNFENISAGLDYLFVNFPFITVSEGRTKINNVLKPKQIFAFHLPWHSEDRFGYNNLLSRSLDEHRASLPPIRVLDRELQLEIL